MEPIPTKSKSVKSHTQQSMTEQFTKLNLNEVKKSNASVISEDKQPTKLKYMIDYTF